MSTLMKTVNDGTMFLCVMHASMFVHPIDALFRKNIARCNAIPQRDGMFVFLRFGLPQEAPDGR